MSVYFFPFVHTWKAGLYCCFRPDCHSKYVLAFLPEDILKMNNFAAPTVQVLRSTHHLFTFYHGVCDYNLSHCGSLIDVSLVKFFKVNNQFLCHFSCSNSLFENMLLVFYGHYHFQFLHTILLS